ncbi:UbiA family prenyltransferase [uncultured Thiodictyon sp.]|uniref:UbiA family prenyltransferase n=1 Tax=uncultured Thiodictyon sp. TaxID=1846217 RepID=UPI0025DF9D87|nr:UbiA family prenyltransferase [uncultured Thiodictyon sp.]
MTDVVLAIDLDGTLLRTDSLLESLFLLMRERPLALGRGVLRLARGRAAFKGWVADSARLDVAVLPLNTPLLDWLQAERAAGRRLVLATAADRRIAEAVAARVGLFDTVLATEAGRNLKGEAKAFELVERFGKDGFDYVGDSHADLPVWREARRAIVVGGPGLERAARRVAEVERVFAPQHGRATALLRAMRPHQWVKNLLLFLPLVAAHAATDGARLLAAALAFLAFGLSASAVYLFNDLLDLAADRRHPRKCRRPFAAGDLPLAWGLLLTPLLLLTAATLSLLVLPPAFTLVLGGYVLLSSAYSVGLKRKPILDVMLLAALYTVRVIAGAAAVAVPASFWLLAFSMFIFLSLALSKRYTELQGLPQRGELTAAGRGWHVDDLPLVQSLGTSAGLACVLVLALYIDSAPAQRLYATPEALWLVCPLLLYWISRLWFKTHRGEMHDDPVVFALRDPVSLLIGALSAGIVILATLWVAP